MPRLKDYVKQIKASLVDLDDDIQEVITRVRSLRGAGKRLWVLGNGGSLSIAQHFAQDLIKMCSVRAHAMNCPSLITANSNDIGFEYSFFASVNKLAEPDDTVIIFSCSGKSRNYIEFVSGFPSNHRSIIAVVGTDGGFLKERADLSIQVKSEDYQVIESAFCIICDIIVKALKLEDSI